MVLPALAAALCVAALPGAEDPKAEALKKEVKALEGTWDGKSRLVDGKEEPPPPGGAQLILEGTKYTIKVEGKVKETGTWTVDPSKTPRTIDLKENGTNEKTPGPCIYEVKGDELKVAVPQPGGERPKDFSGKGTEVYTFKRAKP